MKLEVQSQKVVLQRSDEQLEYGISSQDWDHLKYLIENICESEPIHLTLGTLFWGISITAFFGAMSLPEGVIIMGYPGRLLSWAICIVFFLSGIPCLIYAYKRPKDTISSIEGVKNYIDTLEKKFGDIDRDQDEES